MVLFKLSTLLAVAVAAEESCCSHAVAELEAKWQARIEKLEATVGQQSVEMLEMRQALLRAQSPTSGPAVTAPKPAEPAPKPKPTTLVGVEASGRVRPRRRLAEPTVCAGETCACDGFIYFGNTYASGNPGSGTQNTFEQLTALDFVDQNTGSSAPGYTIVSGARLGGEAVCATASLGVADPAAGYYKQCWCSTDIVSYAHKSNWLVHEFTADNHQHAALTDGRPKQVLPLGADGATTYNPAPNFTGPVNLTLASVGKDWTTTEVESFPAPLKMVHEAGGGLDPTLEIGLATSVPQLTTSQLTTGGVDVGAAITALTAQAYAGWYISSTGQAGNCDWACQNVGLICTETEFAKHIHQADECEEVGNIVMSHYKKIAGPAWTWSGCGAGTLEDCCDTAYTMPTMPNHNTAVNAMFAPAYPGNTAVDCAANIDPEGTNAGNPQRLCYCHAAGLSFASANSHGPLNGR
jgi:hypothetical protein